MTCLLFEDFTNLLLLDSYQYLSTIFCQTGDIFFRNTLLSAETVKIVSIHINTRGHRHIGARGAVFPWKEREQIMNVVEESKLY